MRIAAYHRYGAPEVVGVEQRELPEPGPGEFRVRVHAASVGAADAAGRAGSPWFARLAFGLRRPRNAVLGSDFAGVVDAVGTGVTRFAVGDRVFGATGVDGGAHAEAVVVSQDGAVVLLPDGVSVAAAVAICDGAMTALPFLRDGGLVRRGSRVLVNGASGAVGSAAVRLAVHLGAEVTAVCGPAHVELVAGLGASRVIDYTREDPMRAGAPGAPFDVVFDAVGTSSFRRARAVLRRHGRYLTTVPTWPIMFQHLTSRLGRRRAVIMFTGLRSDEAKRPDLDLLAALAATGGFAPVVDRVLPLDAIARAHAVVDTGHKTGTVVITPVPELQEA
ncbi:NAD(P)-dependent alcohol dehydrogenase [Agromyces marinus]|uniref:NADPH:quinone reductase n=1 Tax=Agromyces marinus TaxID=1389020 RepID=A0ABM8H4T4_9MICO|nr:NAD(P)-dependent alcohol dehydrogenase [Agromyces marinus]UIP59188.1 L-threonine 3-dehydrogenase [Agromyces marinus]BDZ55812.1 NADPH:quinone reductase [Agromyces marinus]